MKKTKTVIVKIEAWGDHWALSTEDEEQLLDEAVDNACRAVARNMKIMMLSTDSSDETCNARVNTYRNFEPFSWPALVTVDVEDADKQKEQAND